jgi:hypothetical protein
MSVRRRLSRGRQYPLLISGASFGDFSLSAMVSERPEYIGTFTGIKRAVSKYAGNFPQIDL